MNTLGIIARSLSHRKKNIILDREDQVLSRRNYYSHPIQNVDCKDEAHSDGGDIYSVYSNCSEPMSDGIKYSKRMSIDSKVTRGTVNDIFDSYQTNNSTHVTVCCSEANCSLKMMFLECGHFVHTKCTSDMLLVGDDPVCPRCAYKIKNDEIKCILIKSMSEYNSERERLEKQKGSMAKIINEYQLALNQCLDSLDQINKTSDELKTFFNRSE